MSTIFTDFVRQMEPGSPEPTAEMFEQVWDVLRGFLVGEMKRRSAWASPPRFLGVVGHPVWTAKDVDSDALDELTAECFQFIFVRRLSSLQDQAKRKPTIDGLVSLATRHFLLDAQRNSDPLGFRIYEVLQRTVGNRLAKGRLVVSSGEEKVRNDTLLTTTRAPSPQNSAAATNQHADPTLLVEAWAQDHLEALVNASHGTLRQLTETLGEQLESWLDEQSRPLRFGDLANRLKTLCRQAWSLRFLDLPPVSLGGSMAEDLDRSRFTELASCVQQRIETTAEKPKTRTYLQRLWRFLEAFAADGESFSLDWDAVDKLPPARQISSLLDIPRSRVPDLIDQLGTQMKFCRQTLDSGEEEPPMPRQTPPPSPRDRAFAAVHAARALSQGRTESTDQPLAAGDIFATSAADVPGVSWLVLESQGTSRFRCVPVDTFPFLAGDDVALGTLDNDSPWVLRLSHQLDIDRDHLCALSRVDKISREDLDRALTGEPSSPHPKIDPSLPAYAEWIEEGPEKARRLLSRASGGEVLRFSKPRASAAAWSQWVAAGLALAALGLGLQVRKLGLEVEQLTEPIINPPYREIQFTPELRGPWQISVPKGATHVEIGLVLEGQPEFESYRIELTGPDNRLLFRSPDQDPRDSYSITFPIRQIDHPSLRFRLFGIEDGKATLLDEEPVELIRGSGP